jgi:ElaB/YqjD/DUF883 family membrane-anchored ribosome-binding protein
MNTVETAADTLTEQVADIRERLKTLMNERVTPAIVETGGQADGFVRAAAGRMKDQSEVISEQLRERPLASVLIAVGIGYLLGRVLH